MSNKKIQYETAFAIQFNEMMADASKEMKSYLDFYKLKKDRLNEYMNQCITDSADSYLPQNIDGIYELAKHNFSKKSIQDFCLRVLHSGRIENAKVFYSEIKDRAVSRLRTFETERDEIRLRYRKAKNNLTISKRYKDAVHLIEKAQSKEIKEMLQDVIDEHEIPVGFAQSQYEEHNKGMIKLLYGKDALENDEKVEFEKFIDKYCQISTM